MAMNNLQKKKVLACILGYVVPIFLGALAWALTKYARLGKLPFPPEIFICISIAVALVFGRKIGRDLLALELLEDQEYAFERKKPYSAKEYLAGIIVIILIDGIIVADLKYLEEMPALKVAFVGVGFLVIFSFVCAPIGRHLLRRQLSEKLLNEVDMEIEKFYRLQSKRLAQKPSTHQKTDNADGSLKDSKEKQ